MEEERQYHPLPNSMDDNGNSAIAKSLRDIPPAHYNFQINSFSALTSLLAEAGVQNYESKVFEVGGYKWKLSLYPEGDKKSDGEGYVSLYLIIEETDDLPPGWEVNVNFKFFVYDQIRDEYMTIHDTKGKDWKVRRFHKMKTKWGFAKLLPLGNFKDAANGYLVSDKCVFGVEVFVLNNSGRGECVNVLKDLKNIYTWKIDKFSSLDEKIHESQVFTLEGRKWKLFLYTKGNPNRKNSELSLFLQLDDIGVPSSAEKVFAKYLLRARDQKNGKHMEETVRHGFSSEEPNRGFDSFLSLTSLHDVSKGFLVNDTLIIETEVITIFTVKSFSK